MEGPILLFRRKRPPRLVHRFEGATPHTPVVVLSPDASEAAELSQALRERQAERLKETGSVFGDRLDGKRPRWRR